MINSFRGTNFFLSNFYVQEFGKINYCGIEYFSAEAAFQASKTFDVKIHEWFSSVQDPKEAKRLGRLLTLRSDWETVKFHIMKDILTEKFRDEFLKDELLETGNQYLEEGNNWHDTFWGVCHGMGCKLGEHLPVGQNYLGILLMEVRSELKEAVREVLE